MNNSFLSSFANVGQAEESQHFPAGEGKTSIRVIKVDHALVLALDETKNQMIDGINHNENTKVILMNLILIASLIGPPSKLVTFGSHGVSISVQTELDRLVEIKRG